MANAFDDFAPSTEAARPNAFADFAPQVAEGQARNAFADFAPEATYPEHHVPPPKVSAPVEQYLPPGTDEYFPEHKAKSVLDTIGGRLPSATASDFDFAAREEFKDSGVVRRSIENLKTTGSKMSAGAGLVLSDLLGDSVMGEYAAEKGRQASQRAAAIGTHSQGAVGIDAWYEDTMVNGLSSTMQNLPGMAGAVALGGAKAIPLVAIGSQQFLQEYSDGKTAGLTTPQNLVRSSMFAGAEVVGEMFGLGKQMKAWVGSMKKMGAKDVSTLLFHAQEQEQLGEQLTTFLEFSADKWLPFGLNQQATLADYVKQVGQTIAQTALQGAFMAGAPITIATLKGNTSGTSFQGGPSEDRLSETYAEDAKQKAMAKAAELFGGTPTPTTRVGPAPAAIVPAAPAAQEPHWPDIAAPGAVDPSQAAALPTEAPAAPGGAAPTASQIPIDPANPAASIQAIADAPITPIGAPIETPAGVDPTAHVDASGDLTGILLAIRQATLKLKVTPPAERGAVEAQLASLQAERQQVIESYEQTHGPEAANNLQQVAAETFHDTKTGFAAPVRPEKATIAAKTAAPVQDTGQGAPVSSGEQHALQEPSTGGVLQREPSQAGEAGGERRGVEPGVQGNAPAEARQAEASGEEIAARYRELGALAPGEPDTINGRTEPTRAQVLAGNYPHAHEDVGGIQMAIENKAGSVRVDKSGPVPKWASKMVGVDYARAKGTQAADTHAAGPNAGKPQEIDMMIDDRLTPAQRKDYRGMAFVVDQVNPKTGAFDEHKVLVGNWTMAQAKAAYLAQYPAGWKGLGDITSTSMAKVKRWMDSGDTSKPFSGSPFFSGNQVQPTEGSVSQPLGAPPGHGRASLNDVRDQAHLINAKAHPDILADVPGSRSLTVKEHALVAGLVKAANEAGVDPILYGKLTPFFVFSGSSGEMGLSHYIDGIRAIGFSEQFMLGYASGALPPTGRYSGLGTIVHELFHPLDIIKGESGLESAAEQSPRLAMREEDSPSGGRMQVAEGDVLLEAEALFKKDPTGFIAYPMSGWPQNPLYGPPSLYFASEVMAQAHATWYTERDTLRREQPLAYELMKRIVDGIANATESTKGATVEERLASVSRAVREAFRAQPSSEHIQVGPGQSQHPEIAAGGSDYGRGAAGLVTGGAESRRGPIQGPDGRVGQAEPGVSQAQVERKPAPLSPAAEREKANALGLYRTPAKPAGGADGHQSWKEREIARLTQSQKGKSAAIDYRKKESKPLGKSPNVLDVAMHFNDLVKQEFGGPLDYTNPEHVARATRLATAEFSYQLGQAKSGLDWYTGDIKAAWDKSAEAHPALNDPVKQQLAGVLIGIMSPALKANANWRFGMQNWDHYERNGEFSPVRPQNGEHWSIRPNTAMAISHLNAMVADRGEAGAVEWLMSPHPVSELNAERLRLGVYKSATVTGKMADQKMGIHIFGPKVGPFTLSVLGINQEVAVDAWATRTTRRYFGTAVTDSTGKLDDGPTERERVTFQNLTVAVGKSEGYRAQEVQSVLWFFEQQAYNALGVGSASHTFSDGARDYVNESGANEVGKDGEPAAVAAEATRQEGGTVVNIGLDVNEGAGRVRQLRPDDAVNALLAAGVKVVRREVRQSATESTLVATISRPLTPGEAHSVAEELRQEAIAQKTDGVGSLHGPEKAKWEPFNNDYFLDHTPDRVSQAQSAPAAERERATALGEYRTPAKPAGGEQGHQSWKEREAARALEEYRKDNPPDRLSQAQIKAPDTPEFKAWFGQSKVVDDSGRPKVLYHGTVSDFGAFDSSKAYEHSAMGQGIYLTDSPEDASHNYANLKGPDTEAKMVEFAERIMQDNDEADQFSYGTKAYKDAFAAAIAQAIEQNSSNLGTVMPLFVRMEKPFIVGGTKDTQKALENSGSARDYVKGEAIEKSRNAGDFEDGGGLLQIVMEHGYDGIIDNTVSRFGTMVGTEGATHYIVPKPTQVKSATGNRGTFSRRDRMVQRQRYRSEDTRNYGEEARSSAKGVELSAAEDRAMVAYDEKRTSILDAAKKKLTEAGILEPQDSLATMLAQKDLAGGALKAESDALAAARSATHNFVSDYYEKNAPPLNPHEQSANQDRDYYNSPSFRKWFGNSKAVDVSGRPLVAFHGTNADIHEFLTSPNPPDRGKHGNPEYSGALGSWFAAPSLHPGNYDEGNAEFTAEEIGGHRGRQTVDQEFTTGSSTYPVHLSVKNPREYDGFDDFRESRDLAGGVKQLRKLLEDNGHDGVVVRNSDTDGNMDRDDWVVFRPEQIKSAIGNRGTFDPQDRMIQHQRAPAAGHPASWNSPELTRMDNVIHALQDKHIDTKRVLAAIREMAPVSDAYDVYLKEEVYHGRAAEGVDDFADHELTPLLTTMAARGVSIPEFEKYLHARHAKERNVQVAKVNPAFPDGGSGMDTADARSYLSGLTAQKKAAYEALAARVDAITAKTASILVAGEIESQATVDSWNKAYSAYVPLKRSGIEAGGMGAGQGFSVKGSSSKRAMGSSKDVENILGNIAEARENAVVRSEKNRVARALVGLAIANPNPDFWAVDQPPTIRSVSPTTGLVVNHVDPLYKSRDNVVMARRLDAKGNITERAVIFNEGDERAMRMASSLKNLESATLPAAFSVVAKGTRYLASINTQYNPIFGLTNLMRDVQQAMFTLTTTPIAGKQAAVLAYALPALKGIYTDLRAARAGAQAASPWASWFERFQRAGGQTGYRELFKDSDERTAALEKQLAAEQRTTMVLPRKSWDAVKGWLSDYNTSGENAIRLAAFRVAIEEGMSDERAASVAKNLTVNFNRKGHYATQVGSLYAFFNASVQGTSRTLEVVRGPKGKAIVVGGILVGVLQALALAAAGFDDDDVPEFERERNTIIPIGGKKYVKIPMSLGLHILPNIGRLATELVLSGFKRKGDKTIALANVILDGANPLGSATFAQTVAPSVVDPFVALSENKNFTGKPIFREDMSKLAPTPGHTRAKPTASAASVIVSKALNVATGGTDYTPGMLSPTPDALDYLAGQVGGGPYREADKLRKTAVAAATEASLDVRDAFVAGHFAGDADSDASKQFKFYENLRMLNEHEGEIKGRQKAHQPTADYRAEHPESRLVDMANSTERMVSELRHQRAELVAKDAPDAKIVAIDAKITARMQMLNAAVRRAVVQ